MYQKISYILIVVLICLGVSESEAQNLAVSNVIRPTTGSTNCTSVPRNDSVEVRIVNLDGNSVSNFDISFQLNNGTVVKETYTGTLNGSSSLDYTFSTTLLTAQGGVNKLKVFTSLAGDVNTANDTAEFIYVPTISNFPYYENFEADNGGFTSGGTNSTWVWGARNKANTGGAGEGTKCWTNGNLTGYYRNSDASYVRTPCFDFTNLKSPYIAFKFLVEIEYNYEVVSIQYSLNGGVSWANLGGNGDPDDCETQNWYNNGRPGWSGNDHSYPCSFGWGGGCNGRGYCGKWAEARRCLQNLAGEPSVMFQWRFTSSGTQCTSEGYALDSLVIGEAPSLTPFDIAFQDSICPQVPINFTSNIANCYSNPRWDFGDGSGILSASSVFHAFKSGGNYEVKLIVDGLCGKVDTLKKQITILPLPVTNITPFGAKLCQTGATVNLTATPTGGTFYVNNAQQNTIDPAALGLGKHFAIYEYTDTGANKCKIQDTTYFEVYLPVATIDNLGGQYCPSAPSFKLQGSPAGGEFFINSVKDSIFDASALGLGNHTVTYTYQDSIGCPASVTQNVSINNSLVVDILGLSSNYCKTNGLVQLNGTPTGGIFTINGTTATDYDPAAFAATPQADTIIYTYSDGSCSNKDTAIVDVVNNNLTINGLNTVYCYDATAVNLTATPAGGSFELDGNTAFGFDPASLTVGNHDILYIYQDPTFGCIDSVSTSITIDKPSANITGVLPNYCIDASKTTLTATPTGGTFTINGTAATEIDPATLGLGNYTLIYTYTNPNGCTVKDTQDFEVVGLPQLQFTNLPKTLCFNSNAVTITTSPTGGAISIDGLPASANFDPSLYTSNQYHVVEYQYVDFNYGCVNTIKDSIFIGIPPTVVINGLNSTYCSSDAAVTLQGSPAGGIFTVNGNNQTNFNPSALGVGSYTVTYTYKDPNGCENSIIQIVDVISNPGDTIKPGPIVEICRGEEVVLAVNGTLPGVWSTNETTKSITVKPTTTAQYWYKVNSCVSYYDTVTVVVNANPSADFELEPSQGFSPLKVKATSKISNANVQKWVFNSTEYTTDPAEHTFNTPGQFSVTLYVVNDKGCKDSIVKTVTVFEGITIPNVFSPNGDLVNDNFGPITQSDFSDYTFKIFNRWGTLMFEGAKPTDRWDGNHNGNPAPEGVYFYLLVAKNLKEFKLEGTVTLVR